MGGGLPVAGATFSVVGGGFVIDVDDESTIISDDGNCKELNPKNAAAAIAANPTPTTY